MGAVVVGRYDEAAVHARVSTGFLDEEAAQVVERSRARVHGRTAGAEGGGTAFGDGVAGDRGRSASTILKGSPAAW